MILTPFFNNTVRGVSANRLLAPVAAILLVTAAVGAEDELSRFVNHPTRPLTAADLEVRMRRPIQPTDVHSGVREESIDLGKDSGLLALKDSAQALLDLGGRQDDYEEGHPEHYLPFPSDVSSSGKRRALREVLALIDSWLDPGPGAARTRLHLLELVNALENSFRYPVKKNYQLIPEIVPMLLLRARQHRSVEAAAGPEADPSPSSFWAPSGDLREKDLYAGFGRATVFEPAAGTCTYLAPKTGWGAHSGFHVRCGAAELHFKLGDERYGGPFNTRIFDALGYRTYPIDRVPALRLAYDRRVLTQFHSRKRLAMSAKVLFIPVKTHVVTDEDDPFDLIEHAVMRDGRRVAGPELRRSLLKDGRVVKGHPRPETVDENYQVAYEAGIEALVWKPGTVAHESEDVRQIGAWDYDQLDHADRREVRAVFVLAAWLDQFNMRWENTRVAYVKRGSAWELQHLFSDVGSGLGLARTLIRSRNSDVEAMLWEVTERKGNRVRFSGFAVNVDNKAFERLTWSDARWMLRRLATLSEAQILDGLLATGMSAAEVRLALEKLVSKRKRMVLDFDLAAEFPAIAGRVVDRELDFDPHDPADLARVTRTGSNGPAVTPPMGDLVVVDGHLVRRGAARTSDVSESVNIDSD
jgi:hypothetical protein